MTAHACPVPARRRVPRPAWLTCLLLLAGMLLATGAGAARNVILMVGDGMGPDTVAAAGAYRYGAAHQRFGGRERLALETLAVHRYVTTGSTDGRGYDFGWDGGRRDYVQAGATDSAAAATAMATGVKTYNAAIGVDRRRQPLRTILETAAARGLRTGLVTSVPFCHATPAAFAAHNENRNHYQAIAHDMLFAVCPDVVMGGGSPVRPGDNTLHLEYLAAADWEALAAGRTPYRVLRSRAEFLGLVENPGHGKVLGLFPGDALRRRGAAGTAADPQQPTLADMTRSALAVLANPKGFFLMVEGGAIDHANHANQLDESVGETLGFDEAVQTVLAWIAAHGGWADNQLVITADHDTGYLREVAPAAAGSLPAVQWGLTGAWGGHTNRLVDLYAQGPASAALDAFTLRTVDCERGPVAVVDNTAVYFLLEAALPAPAAPAAPAESATPAAMP